MNLKEDDVVSAIALVVDDDTVEPGELPASGEAPANGVAPDVEAPAPQTEDVDAGDTSEDQ
jgi:hypothetical protein